MRHYRHKEHFAFLLPNEPVMGVPVPDKWDRSLITWDPSQKVECFGNGPITLINEQLSRGNHVF